MDFRAALVNSTNANSSYMNPHLQPDRMGEPVHSSSPVGNRKTPVRDISGETSTRRRRRRRNNGTKMAIETLLEEECLQECVYQEHTPPYTPLRGDFGEIPSLQVLEASPVATLSWPPTEGPERVSMETLNAIAERARERLSIRIQAYQDERQKVAEAAARIQDAYANHMESQLGAIIVAMQGHLSTAIDTKLDSFKQAWQEEISSTLGDLEHNPSSQYTQDIDPKAIKIDRISVLEGETHKLIELMSTKKEEQLASDGAVHGDMLAILRQLQVQGERTDHSLKELFNISKQTSLETNELRDAMNAAGLFPQATIPSTPHKIKSHIDTVRLDGSAKGKHSLVFVDKENTSSSGFGLSSSPTKSNHSSVSMVHMPLHL